MMTSVVQMLTGMKQRSPNGPRCLIGSPENSTQLQSPESAEKAKGISFPAYAPLVRRLSHLSTLDFRPCKTRHSRRLRSIGLRDVPERSKTEVERLLVD